VNFRAEAIIIGRDKEAGAISAAIEELRSISVSLMWLDKGHPPHVFAVTTKPCSTLRITSGANRAVTFARTHTKTSRNSGSNERTIDMGRSLRRSAVAVAGFVAVAATAFGIAQGTRLGRNRSGGQTGGSGR
jgi:hypothetical protein